MCIRMRAWLMQRAGARIAVALLVVVLPEVVLAPLRKHFATGVAPVLLCALFSVLISLGAYAAYVRWLEQRVVRELSLQGVMPELLAGIGIGSALFIMVVGILYGLGAFRVIGLNPVSVMLATIPDFVVGAVFEEILFRAVIFRILEGVAGSWIALVVSATMFGMMHLGNPGADLLGALTIAVEAGVMLAAAYMVTRRLWLCIAIHFAWNFVQGGIFSVAVSGYAQQGLFQSQRVGADWLTGGAFGVELSVVAAVLCGVLGVLMLVQSARADNIIRPYWRRVPV